MRDGTEYLPVAIRIAVESRAILLDGAMGQDSGYVVIHGARRLGTRSAVADFRATLCNLKKHACKREEVRWHRGWGG